VVPTLPTPPPDRGIPRLVAIEQGLDDVRQAVAVAGERVPHDLLDLARVWPSAWKIVGAGP